MNKTCLISGMLFKLYIQKARLLEGERQKREVLALKIWHCVEKEKSLKESNCHLVIPSESLRLKNKWSETVCCPQPVQRCAAHSKWCSGQRKGLGWCYPCNKDIWYFLHIFTCELLIIHHHLTFLMWGGTESLNKTFRKQNTWFLATQLHSSQGYVGKTLWNPTSEQTVSVVTYTLLKISNSWGGPQPSQFQQLLSACSEIAPLEWSGLPLNLSFLCISCGTPKTERHTDYFLSFNSP